MNCTEFLFVVFSAKKSTFLEVSTFCKKKKWKGWFLLNKIHCKWSNQLDFAIHCNFLICFMVNHQVFQFFYTKISQKKHFKGGTTSFSISNFSLMFVGTTPFWKRTVFFLKFCSNLGEFPKFRNTDLSWDFLC